MTLCSCFRHEDGTVRFWDASGVALTPLYKLSTANVFHTDCDPSDDPQDPSDDPDMQQEEEWPPFRKVRAEEACMRSRLMEAFELKIRHRVAFYRLGEYKLCVLYTHSMP